MNSWLLYLLLFLFCFVAALFIGKIQGWGDKAKGSKGKTRSSLGCLVMALLLASAFVLLVFASFIFTFSPFSPNRAVLTIQTTLAITKSADFTLTMKNAGQTTPPEQKFNINGTAWGLGGEVLVWKKPLPSLGLRPMYRLTHLRGYYPSGSTAAGRKPTLQKLATSGDHLLYRTAARLNKTIPMATILPTQTATQPLLLNSKYTLFITPEGFRLLAGDGRNGGVSNPSLRNNPNSERPRTKYPEKVEDVRK